MADTIRAALERLVNTIDGPVYDLIERLNAIAAARAALAEPVGEGPSEEGIAEMAEDLEWRRLPRAEGTGNSFLLDLALAVLARWACPAAPPAPEPGELELSLKEIEAQAAFTQMRDEILNLSDGVEVNEVLSIIDNYTPEWV